MLGKDKIKEITDRVLAYSGADQTEVLMFSETEHLTRFANSYIHQNVSETNAQVRVRAVVGKRTGVASTNDLRPAALEKVVNDAVTAARLQQENPDFKTLPGAAEYQQVESYVARTADFTPEERARMVKILCDKARERTLSASGAFSTTDEEFAVANSRGVFGYHPSTQAELMTVIMGDSGSGFASRTCRDVADIDAAALANIAIEKALKSRDPIAIEPGEYTVILEEDAVGDMVGFLAYMGLSALAVQEKRSFMCDRFGERIVGENITIWDDGLDTRSAPLPFDYEGVPKQRVELIANGIAKGVVYDTYTAGREAGKHSTGHALPAPNTYGPFPLNLFLQTGAATKEEMLASTKRGIWVTRFHYTNGLHPLKTIFTGMTRDGTFLIEDGEITRPLKNLRFTQSILDALSNVEMISRDAKLYTDFFGAIHVPALKVRNFTFSGVTEF